MIDIFVSDLVKSFDQEKKILDSVSFQINEGEKVGLLGPNGAGKTTLFRILTGEIDYDSGQIVIGDGRRMGLVSQIPVYPETYTVEDVLKSAFERVLKMQTEMRALEQQMQKDASPMLLRRYGAISDMFERAGGYETEVALNKVAAGLEIPDSMRAQPFCALSGGEKTRVNLARLILEDTDILLLDEPTNHLDLRATEWLENYLLQFRGTVLVISHDRYFLNQVVGRIIEVEDGHIFFYNGNYSFYVEEKKKRFLEQQKQYEKEQAKIAQLSTAAQRMHGWGIQNEKLQKRAFAMEKRIERMQKTEKPKEKRTLQARFQESDFFGDEVLMASGLSMSYPDKPLFHDVDLLVAGGERIAILGDNGTGKTTLLKVLLGECEPDLGRVRMGPTIKCGYLPQVISFSYPERNLLDSMIYEANCSHQEARDRLGAFSFRGEDVFKSVSALSGGEKSRLRLCMLMDMGLNFLVLDEPTNHLDLRSREWMEEAVEDYEGCLLFVSHDRYFIRRFATRIWFLENGVLTDFKGNFDAFRSAQALQTRNEQVIKEKIRHKAPKREKRKQPEKQIAAIEREISVAETEQKRLEAEMEAAACDYTRLETLYEEKKQIEETLESLYGRWEELAAQVEAGAI